MAKNLGVRVNASRIFLSGVSAFLAAATVSEVGMIGFVGLVAPHIARLLVGSNYKVMLVTSIMTGSLMVLLADTVGRTVWPGTEIPVGVMMSICGGPFFLYMLRKRGKFSASVKKTDGKERPLQTMRGVFFMRRKACQIRLL